MIFIRWVEALLGISSHACPGIAAYRSMLAPECLAHGAKQTPPAITTAATTTTATTYPPTTATTTITTITSTTY